MSKPKFTDAADRAIAAMGSGVALARACGVSNPAIAGWRLRGVPADRVQQVSALTGIPPHELRPDIFHPPKDAT